MSGMKSPLHLPNPFFHSGCTVDTAVEDASTSCVVLHSYGISSLSPCLSSAPPPVTAAAPHYSAAALVIEKYTGGGRNGGLDAARGPNPKKNSLTIYGTGELTF